MATHLSQVCDQEQTEGQNVNDKPKLNDLNSKKVQQIQKKNDINCKSSTCLNLGSVHTLGCISKIHPFLQR